MLSLPFVSANSYWAEKHAKNYPQYDHHSVGYLGSHYSSVTIDGRTSYSYETVVTQNCNGEFQSRKLSQIWRYNYPYHYTDSNAPQEMPSCPMRKHMPSYQPEQKCMSCACQY